MLPKEWSYTAILEKPKQSFEYEYQDICVRYDRLTLQTPSRE